MSPKAIPDRWLEYKACGAIIEGTRIICFKVPLRKVVQEKEPTLTEIWDIPAVLARIPKLSAVIDLTNTDRYYNPNDFRKANILHKKILMPGRVIPPERKVKEFMDTVDEFLGVDCESLIGVHCTHGLNRTGYMVCRYMRDRLGIPGPEALSRFEHARGYKVERPVYINDIIRTNTAQDKGKKPRQEQNKSRKKQSEIIDNTQSEQSSVSFKTVIPPESPFTYYVSQSERQYFQRNKDEKFGNSRPSDRELMPSNSLKNHKNVNAQGRDIYNNRRKFEGPPNYSVSNNSSAFKNFSEPNNFTSKYMGPRVRSGPKDFNVPNNYSGSRDFSAPNKFSGPSKFNGSNNYSEPNNYSGPKNYDGPSSFRETSNLRGPSNFRGPNQRHYHDRYNGGGARYKSDGNSNQPGRNSEHNWRNTRKNQSNSYTWRNSNYVNRKLHNNSEHRRFDESDDF